MCLAKNLPSHIHMQLGGVMWQNSSQQMQAEHLRASFASLIRALLQASSSLFLSEKQTSYLAAQ